jgi:hypothetical protein
MAQSLSHHMVHSVHHTGLLYARSFFATCHSLDSHLPICVLAFRILVWYEV